VLGAEALPYGPLVEQLPLLPPIRAGIQEQQAYFKKCLETNMVGDVKPLTDEMREVYADWLNDEDILRHQALNQFQNQKRFEQLEKLETEEEQVAAWLGGELPPVHLYRMPYDLGLDGELDEADFPPEIWEEILRLAVRWTTGLLWSPYVVHGFRSRSMSTRLMIIPKVSQKFSLTVNALSSVIFVRFSLLPKR
jgi:hypothetical protein